MLQEEKPVLRVLLAKPRGFCAGVERAIDAEGLQSRMVLQVHDELVLEVAPGEQESITDAVREAMAGAADLAVPLDVGVGIGQNWRAAAH